MIASVYTINTNRIPELDGLRGIAILLVISFHYLNNQLVNSKDSLGKAIAFITSFGWVGVDLFFVLSGFLIGTILIANRNSHHYFSTFYIRRVVRILPNYYLFLVIFILLSALPFFSKNNFLFGNAVIPIGSYFLMIHNIFMAVYNNLGSGSLSITWSIAIEEQFYLIFPLIIYFVNDKFLPWVLILIIISASVIRLQFHHWIPPYVLLPCRMDGLALGMLVAYLNIRTDFVSLVSDNRRQLLGLMILIVFGCTYFYYLYHDLGIVKHTLFALFFTGCLIFALGMKSSWYAFLLRNKFLMWVGTISYSLYLFHYFILGFTHHLFGNSNGIGINNFKDVSVTGLALLISFFVSWFVYKRLEQPMVRFGKKFVY